MSDALDDLGGRLNLRVAKALGERIDMAEERLDDHEKRLTSLQELMEGQMKLIALGENLVTVGKSVLKYFKFWAPVITAAIAGAGIGSERLTKLIDAIAALPLS